MKMIGAHVMKSLDMRSQLSSDGWWGTATHGLRHGVRAGVSAVASLPQVECSIAAAHAF